MLKVAENQLFHWACQHPVSFDSKRSRLSQLLVPQRLLADMHRTTSNERGLSG